MARNRPDLSVVTVVLNDKSGLEKAISSVRQQTGLEIEHIIVDGGSHDGSADIAALHSTVSIESRPDGGIYPAMQRGATAASGEFLIFCNSGDALFGDSYLAEAVRKLKGSVSSWGFGPIIEHTERGTFSWVPCDPSPSAESILSRKSFVPFPSFIIKRDFFDEIGIFSKKYKIAGDFELISKAALRSLPVVFESPIAIFSAGGISYTSADRAWREEIAIRKDLLQLSQFQLFKEWRKYTFRFVKWKLGKFLDSLETLIHFKKTSWRDSRATPVPSEFCKFLPK